MQNLRISQYRRNHAGIFHGSRCKKMITVFNRRRLMLLRRKGLDTMAILLDRLLPELVLWQVIVMKSVSLVLM